MTDLHTDLAEVVKHYTGHTRQDFISELVRVCDAYTAERVADARIDELQRVKDNIGQSTLRFAVENRLAELRASAATKEKND
jgi:hypothetical protein